MNGSEISRSWNTLKHWALDKKGSRIVRVNSVQGLFELSLRNNYFTKELKLIFHELRKENIPSLNSRIKKLTF